MIDIYNNNLKSFSNELRKKGTKGEAVLWKYVLRAKKTGYQFNRQFIIGNYIEDFICRKLKLIIEIDGNCHDFIDETNTDYEREEYLKSKGIYVLRFSESEILKELEAVSNRIEFAIHCIEEEREL